MKIWITVLLALVAFPSKSFAWGKKGHEVVAYIAYQNLNDVTRKEVDYLLTLNPCYHQWQQQVASLPVANQPVALFMLSATWPDAIKQPSYSCDNKPDFIRDGGDNAAGHFSEDIPPSGPEASQNIGYADNRRHKYWHFINTPFSTDNTATHTAETPNSVTELAILLDALQTSQDPNLKSYDLAWVEHLVGDIHQPLHSATRFTAGMPDGDEGGNSVRIVQSPQELHGYWDDLPGSDSLSGAILMGKTLNGPRSLNTSRSFTAATLNIDDPAAWAADSFQLAQQFVYASPVNAGASGDSPSNLNPAYTANAKKVMNKQLTLAGRRLAVLLNEELS